MKALVVLMVLLAGCAAPQAADVQAAAPGLLASGLPQTDAVVEAEGRFAPTESCLAGGCLLSGLVGSEHSENIDITPALHRGVPTLVHAVLEHDDADIRLRFLPHGHHVYWSSLGTDEEGRQVLEALVARTGDDPLWLQVFAWEVREEAAWALKATLASSPERLPPGLPVAVVLAPEERLVFEPSDARVLAWGPDDAHLGALTGGLTARTAGEHVLFVQGPQTVRLWSEAQPGPWRPLALKAVAEEAGRLRGTGTHAWSFDLDDAQPLGVGMRIREPSGGPMTVARAEGSITGPDGAVLAFQDENIHSGAYDALTWTSRPGAPLAPGTYDAAFTVGATTELLIEQVVVVPDRDTPAPPPGRQPQGR